MEIRALASIGAGLLMRHLGDPKAINKLARLAVSFDDFRKGFHLFNQKLVILTKKYEENDPKIKVENPTKNRAFSFFVAELRTYIAKKKKIVPQVEVLEEQ